MLLLSLIDGQQFLLNFVCVVYPALFIKLNLQTNLSVLKYNMFLQLIMLIQVNKSNLRVLSMESIIIVYILSADC